MVLGPLEALVGHVGSPEERRAHADEPGVRGSALTAKKVSAICWSAVEAAPKQKPVITPEGSTAQSGRKPSYHRRLLDQPMSACPASQPAPRRLASRMGIAELSGAS